MNKMEQLAKVFDLELEEEFKISERPNNIYKFTSTGMVWKHFECSDITYGSAFDYTVSELLLGHLFVRKIPRKWKPKFGEEYYVPSFSYNSLTLCFVHHIWHDDEYYDNWCYKIGIVCQTKEEAMLKAKTMLASIKD